MPAIIATPSRTAIAVSAVRSLRCAEAAQGEADHAQRLEVVEDLLHAQPGVLVDDAAVREEQHAVGDRGGGRRRG